MSHADHSFDPTEKSVVSFAHYKFSVLHADNTVVLFVELFAYVLLYRIQLLPGAAPFAENAPRRSSQDIGTVLLTVLLEF